MIWREIEYLIPLLWALYFMLLRLEYPELTETQLFLEHMPEVACAVLSAAWLVFAEKARGRKR